MAETQIRIRAKINLFLQVGQRREDGYHLVNTLMLPLPEGSPEDILRISPRPEPGLGLRCDLLPPDESNTVSRAYAAWSQATGHHPGLNAQLIKGIPHGAGLGGGSADAAALLRYLQSQATHPLTEQALNQVAASVGADVPFFLGHGPALARGIGENLAPCPSPVAGLFGLLLCPAVSINTAWAYRELDRTRKLNTAILTEQGKPGTKRVSDVTSPMWLENSFESVVFAVYPQLARLKEELLRQNACLALMSGSGSSLFGLFRSAESARRAFEALNPLPCGGLMFGPLSF